MAPTDTCFRGTDEELRSAVADADLPALLAILAMLTGDDALLDPGLEPSREPLEAAVPHAGRNDAAGAARGARASGPRADPLPGRRVHRPQPSDADWRRRVICFLTGLDEHAAGPGELSLLEHELDPPQETRLAARASGHRSMEVSEDEYWRHGRMVDEESARRAWGAGRASGWYVNDKGRVSQVWPLGPAGVLEPHRDADPDDYLLR